MRDSEYDVASICTNGHPINTATKRSPQENAKFCDTCGAKAVDQCGRCGTPIRGYYWGSISLTYEVPAYCRECGKAFPWIEARTRALGELLAESGISEAERTALMSGIPSLVAESPETSLAVVRWKKYLSGAGRQITEGLRELIVSIASETIRRQLFPG